MRENLAEHGSGIHDFSGAGTLWEVLHFGSISAKPIGYTPMRRYVHRMMFENSWLAGLPAA